MNILILCNGQPPTRKLFEESTDWADLIIAADGGANIAMEYGIPPDLVIGDMDSFEEQDSSTLDIIYDPDQESNDLEKALGRAQKEQARHVIALGATGKRLDQSLKNLSVLKQFNDRFASLLFRDNYGDTMLLPKSYSRPLDLGTLVSLFPLSGSVTGIKTGGLKYPLNNESLKNGVRDGSSNEVISSPVSITYEEGDLLMFLGR